MRDTAIWLRGIKAGNRFLPFESLGQLDRLHGKCHVAERDRKWERAARAATELFPEAPLPGTGHIVPIRSSAELYREGIEMDNCVPDYLGDALSGYACFYKVLYPVRGTLAIGDKGFYGHSRWVPAAMYGKSNRKIPSEIVHATFEALFQRARGRERLERYLGMEEKPDPELAL